MRNIITSSALAVGAIVAAATFTAPQAALAQQNGPICLQSESGAQDCSYRSMAQCLQSRSGSEDTCGINPAIGGTVGFGGGAPYVGEGRAPLRSPQPEPGFTR